MVWVHGLNREAPAAASAAVANSARAGSGIGGNFGWAGGWMMLVLSDLQEALAVCLMCCNGCWPIAGACHSTGTVVGVAAIVSVYDEVPECQASKGEENECWSHDE